MLKRLFLLLPVLLCAASCSRPHSYEAFVMEKDARSGIYSFDLDMSDSTVVYDIYLYTRVDRGKLSSEKDDATMRLDIWWVAPSQSVYDETVYMNPGDYRGVRQLYRKGVVPSENGVWKLSIKPADAPASLCGMGVICDSNGTR